MSMQRGWRHPMTWAVSALVLLFLAAPSAMAEGRGWLLPESISEIGDRIDHLFWVIFVLVGVVFVGTEGLLLWFMVKYRAKEGGKAHYTHGNHKLEIIWTLIPAVILGVLAFAQFGLWQEIKDPEKAPINDPRAVEVHVLAKQFEWLFRYPGPDNTWGTEDDFSFSRLVVPQDRPVIVRLKSLDVIHSLYLPELRFKQDAVPGLVITGWFQAYKSGNWEIACAELCGASHYKMRGEYEIVPENEWDARYAEMAEKAGPIDYGRPTEFFRFWPLAEYVDELKKSVPQEGR
ncbi:MAG: cytochrome c oxidase subunit II [Planctomycetes bacterium]|nr:cytochrome c oxidase subunit II [Planctomycetota bacterium]